MIEIKSWELRKAQMTARRDGKAVPEGTAYLVWDTAQEETIDDATKVFALAPSDAAEAYAEDRDRDERSPEPERSLIVREEHGVDHAYKVEAELVVKYKIVAQ